ncbi:tautomerase family protein [Anaerosporobacter sp.]|uniref:tautomerase family protein n=1 Tax=Anaerosporobacter sp. TaxID=1872529 RepID=UPI00289B1AB0|nr:tautomerase family protein [Anaerosporobacter sp.]
MFPGRSKEIKKKVIETIKMLLGERLGIVAADIFIVIHEPSFDNWGMGGIQLSDE